ncbi:glycosyltransferase family 4 protein [Arthrobacter sp. Ld5]|uniref:glycosyltransferase family 4 protein n=1 Tax=Arthrobacter sp. Ld5 TaxID=649152 RepID=UPI003EB74100
MRFAYEAAKHLSELSDLEVFVSYSVNAEIASWWARLGVAQHRVTTFSSRRSLIATVLSLPIKAVQLHRFCRRHSIDVVFSPMEQVFQAAVAPSFRWSGRKYILGIHDGNLHPGEESAAREALRAYDLRFASSYVVFSDEVGDLVEKRTSNDPKRILKMLHPSLSSNDVSARTLSAGAEIVLGFFGRILPYKGVPLLLEAGEILRSRGHNVVVRLYGQGDVTVSSHLMTAPLVQDRRGWVAEESIEEVVDGFDLLILPYIEASQSGVLAVAAGRGIPVVATPVGGLAEQVIASGAGVVSTAVSGQSIADAIERLLANPLAYAAHSRAGIATGNGSMSWRAAAERFSTEFSLSVEATPGE